MGEASRGFRGIVPLVLSLSGDVLDGQGRQEGSQGAENDQATFERGELFFGGAHAPVVKFGLLLDAGKALAGLGLDALVALFEFADGFVEVTP